MTDHAGILALDSVVLSGTATSRDEAISEAGRLLVASGAVDAAYVDAMHDRESSVSTYMGSFLAIPHGTNEAKDSIRRTALSFVRYPGHVDWNGHPVEFVIGIAGVGNEHLELLGKIAMVFVDAGQVERLRGSTTREEILAVLDSAT